MRSLQAHAWLVAAVLFGTASALPAQPSPRPAPAAGADATVRAELAARWAIGEADVVLEWGLLAGTAPADARAIVQSGAGSSWVVVFRDAADRQTGSARVRAGTRALQHVAAREIARGEAIDADAIAAHETVRWGPPVPASSPEGWVAKRRIAAGEPLVAPAVSAPELVRSGDSVRLIVQSGDVTLTAAATALGTGGLGARVAVRTDGGKRIDTTVTGPGEVRIRGSQR